MPTTQWSQVLLAKDGREEAGRAALASLCESYWTPIYSYIRKRGSGHEEASDLTQEFFTRFIDKDYLSNVAPSKGKFRNFLLAALSHFLANEWDKKSALKRGGGIVHLSMDFSHVERQILPSSLNHNTPEDAYNNEWALSVLDRAHRRLVEESQDTAMEDRLKLLSGYLTAKEERLPYKKLAEASGTSISALRVSAHRLRKRYGELILDEVSRTLSEDEDIGQEIEYLLTALK